RADEHDARAEHGRTSMVSGREYRSGGVAAGVGPPGVRGMRPGVPNERPLYPRFSPNAVRPGTPGSPPTCPGRYRAPMAARLRLPTLTTIILDPDRGESLQRQVYHRIRDLIDANQVRPGT